MKRIPLLLLVLLVVIHHRAFCDEADDRFSRGKAKFWRGDTNGAMAEFNRVIELDPKYIDAYPNRAFLRQARGDLDGAIADYTKAIELKPGHVLAYSNRGNTRQLKGDLDGAVADYTKAIELDPNYAFAYYEPRQCEAIQGRSGWRAGGLHQGHRP